MKKLLRTCPHCEMKFKCNGQCQDKYRIENDAYCYCKECYKEFILPYIERKPYFKGRELERIKCPEVPRYIKKKLKLLFFTWKLEG